MDRGRLVTRTSLQLLRCLNVVSDFPKEAFSGLGDRRFIQLLHHVQEPQQPFLIWETVPLSSCGHHPTISATEFPGFSPSSYILYIQWSTGYVANSIRVLAGALEGLWSRYSCIEASALSAGGVRASVRRLEHPCQSTLVGTHALLTTLAAYHVWSDALSHPLSDRPSSLSGEASR